MQITSQERPSTPPSRSSSSLLSKGKTSSAAAPPCCAVPCQGQPDSGAKQGCQVPQKLQTLHCCSRCLQSTLRRAKESKKGQPDSMRVQSLHCRLTDQTLKHRQTNIKTEPLLSFIDAVHFRNIQAQDLSQQLHNNKVFLLGAAFSREPLQDCNSELLI